MRRHLTAVAFVVLFTTGMLLRTVIQQVREAFDANKR